jgi:2-keto-3-deoxy-L-rhamnonate aldolase RhmA
MTGRFQLLLFSTLPEFVREAVAAGVDGVIVDWENIGKERRQLGADTQINFDTVEDLRRVRACTEALVVCRINACGSGTAAEVEQALNAGADELLLPMVTSVAEVETVLDAAAGRCAVGILVETVQAVELAEQLGRLPLSRVYVGLNDLAIQRGTGNIFAAVADGVVERVRHACSMPFGFAGLTLPECGSPIACRLLMGEMARLRCDFTFLRRSFLADIRGRELAKEVPRIKCALEEAANRTPSQAAQHHEELLAAIAAWPRPADARGT